MTRWPARSLTDAEDAMEAALGGNPRSPVDALTLVAFDKIDVAFETEGEMVRAWADLRDELRRALDAGWRGLGEDQVARQGQISWWLSTAPLRSTD